MSRLLYLHIGMQKSGSSFLQHLLRKNAHLLEDRGISYKHYIEELVSSGNGDLFLNALGDEAAPVDFRRMIDTYFGGRNTAVISSELLYSVDLKWDLLWKRLRYCDVRTELIVFYRSPVEYITSAYSQVVKREGYVGTLRNFIDERPTDLYDLPFRKIVAASEAETYDLKLHVFSYTAHKNVLWETFLNVLNLEPAEFKKEDVVVNPSFSAQEVELQRIYNKLFPQESTGRFASFIQGQDLFRHRTAITLTSEEVDHVRRAYEDKMEFLNEFVTGTPIELSPAKLAGAGSVDFSIELKALEIILTFLYSREGRLLALLPELETLVTRATTDSPDKDAVLELCPDFDPLGYLVRNPEVLKSEANPYRHFLVYGRDEGRKYKLED